MRKLVNYILLLWNLNMVPEIQKFAKFLNNLFITLNAWKSINFFVAYDRAGRTLSNKLVNKCFWTLKKNYSLYRDPLNLLVFNSCVQNLKIHCVQIWPPREKVFLRVLVRFLRLCLARRNSIYVMTSRQQFYSNTTPNPNLT